VTVAAAFNVLTVDVGLWELVVELVRRELVVELVRSELDDVDVVETVVTVDVPASCLKTFKLKAVAAESKIVKPKSKYMVKFTSQDLQVGIPSLYLNNCSIKPKVRRAPENKLSAVSATREFEYMKSQLQSIVM
jgi:hypothetical protein